MSFISFLLQVNLGLFVFYAFYRLFLHKETFFIWNRVYLISTVCFSFALPILHFEWLSKSSVTKQVQLKMVDILVEGNVRPTANFDCMQLLTILYFFGLAVSIMLLIYKLWSLRTRLHSQEKGIAFSFFSFKRVDPNLEDFGTINRHEEVHVQQFHSIDVLLMEVAGLIVWFNPVIYWYKLSIKNIHEYLADEAAAEFQGSKKKYALLLLSKAMGLSPDLTNSFIHQSAVKKRILMLQRERSGKQSLWKYLWLVPLLSTLLLLSSAIKGTTNQGTTVKGSSWIEKGVSVAKTGLREESNDTFGAEFPGGTARFLEYLKEEIKYPEIDLKKGTEGKVLVTFIIDKDGTLTDATIKEGISPGLDQEALRVIRNSPGWIPGKEKGVPVKIRYDIGVNFKR